MLVYYEKYSLLLNAIAREKQLKKWKREWKIRLIEKNNQEWKNLYHNTE
jgi:putative endonuclease